MWLTHEQFQSVQDPDFAEVLTDLNSRELFWLSRGQLEIAVTAGGQDSRRISGFITGRKSCDSKYPCHLSTGEMRTCCTCFFSPNLPSESGTNTVHATNTEIAENVFSVAVGLCWSICGCFCHSPL